MKSTKVLVVDGNRQQFSFIANLARQYNVDVEFLHATTGDQAFNQLFQDDIQILMTSTAVPTRPDFDRLVEHTRGAQLGTVIIAMTMGPGLLDSSDRSEAEELGVDLTIAKHSLYTRLSETLEKAVELARAPQLV